MVGLLIGASATAVYASAAESRVYNFGPIGGYSYYNQATVEKTGDNVYYTAEIGSQNSGKIPVGYMSAGPRLFKGDALCKASEMTYNSSATASMRVGTYGNCGSGIYNSRGATEVFDGSGYRTYLTNVTPNINF
ncbi:hypothetical protein [Brevibacillus agri]|uniref:hypothetical protein n=1 Tax=Brevibacillus agri TaxID=51101 RepID=UPI0025B66394|nr:hypothetical protein [Brevibacillus agri]MDN4095900.1 hypothetical protein [Brevibacillus agri]MED1825658.1 hypothetical protein [Brevibacillus agri]